MTAQEIRSAYLKFFAERNHAVIPRALLVPQNDPTTLFTGSGMQPLLPYLLGEVHPAGDKVVDSQPAFRAEDIDDVGDNRHTTSFEMLGNWSFGDYFKERQIPWMFEFLTTVVKLDPTKLYVTCFIGAPEFGIEKDTVAGELWHDLFTRHGVNAKAADIGSEADGYRRGILPGERIFYYDGSKNWWNRGKTGPATTPIGDPCGPDSEMFFDFGTPHDPQFGEHCHPNCDCGRFMEIGNNVFMAYRKVDAKTFEPLQRRNIDHGSGLERIAAAKEGSGDMFRISLLWPIIAKLEQLSGHDYSNDARPMRIIADHLRSAVFMATDGVAPSNTQQGYVMRRLLRRAIRQAFGLGLKDNFFESVIPVITSLYRDDYPEVLAQESAIIDVLMREEVQFRRTLERGIRIFNKFTADASFKGTIEVTGEDIFTLSDTYGFPVELTLEEIESRNAHDAGRITLRQAWEQDYDQRLKAQRDRSRTASAGQFKGGLADHSEQVVKYHTATHLMYRALRIVLGEHVVQRGSNITAERLRFDFSHPDKMTPEQLVEVERLVNEQIAADLPVSWHEYSTQEAFKLGAMGAFGDKYGDSVKVYQMGEGEKQFSFEICGGPHVEHTGVLADGGKIFKIKKEESSSSGVRRIKAVLE